ncbi:MAG: hypothetical protein U5R31_16280 [Acidimicrobiia bacterium]|nr:hypothetical protein [Acidimicrobiia bacterium]
MQMGEIGCGPRDLRRALVGVAVHPSNEVAGGAGLLEGLEPGLLLLGQALGRRVLQLVLDPLVVLVGREGDDVHLHAGMGQSAELGALPTVPAGLVGLDRPRGRPPRHGVTLAVERGNPEGVDHVRGRDGHLDLAAGGDHHLVRRDEVELAVVVDVVLVGPPPLLPRDGHREGVVVDLAQVEDRGERRRGQEDEDDRGEDGPADLETRAAVLLLGEVVVVLLARLHAIAGRQEDDPALDEHEDDTGDAEDPPGEREDLLGGWTLGVEGVERRRGVPPVETDDREAHRDRDHRAQSHEHRVELPGAGVAAEREVPAGH